MGLHPGGEDGCGERVVALGDRVEDRLDQPVVRRAVGVAEPLDAQLANADGQLAAGLVAHAIPAGKRIEYHSQAVTLRPCPLGSRVKISFAARTSPPCGLVCIHMAPPLRRPRGLGAADAAARRAGAWRGLLSCAAAVERVPASLHGGAGVLWY